MIEIYRRPEVGHVDDIWIIGHANYAPHGQDIVCAAVSTLINTTQIGLEHVAFVPYHYRIVSGSAWFGIKRHNEKSRAIMDTLAAGLAAIANQYPEYVKLKVGVPHGTGPDLE